MRVRQINELIATTNLLGVIYPDPNVAARRTRGVSGPTPAATCPSALSPQLVRAYHAHLSAAAKRWHQQTSAVPRDATAGMATPNGSITAQLATGTCATPAADAVASGNTRRCGVSGGQCPQRPLIGTGGHRHTRALGPAHVLGGRVVGWSNGVGGGTATRVLRYPDATTARAVERVEVVELAHCGAVVTGKTPKTGGRSRQRARRRSLREAAQRQSAQNTWTGDRNLPDATACACESECIEPDRGLAARHDYRCSVAEPIRAAAVSLPDAPGRKGFTELLPAEYAARYSCAGGVLRPNPNARRRPARVHGSTEEYGALVKRLLALGMVKVSGERPAVVNGVFAVKKGETQQRLIIDARNANDHFVVPERVALAAPDLIADLYAVNLRLRRGSGTVRRRQLWVGKTDLADFYHTLRLPEWMCTYFGLPAVSYRAVGIERDGEFHPVCCTLPMGFSHSVLIAQLIHEHVVRQAGVMEEALPLTRYGSTVVTDDTPRIQLYIDDAVVYGTSRDAVLRVQRRYIAAMTAAGLTVKSSKTVEPTTGPVECLGLTVHGAAGTVGVSPEKLCDLIRDTHDLLARHWVTGREVSRIVGRWSWAMLVRRPALSVFSSVYRFAQQFDERRVGVWPSVARELRRACYLAPLLYARIGAPALTSVLATDASSEGYGAVTTRLVSDVAVRRLAVSTLSPGLMGLAAARGNNPPRSSADNLLHSLLSAVTPSAPLSSVCAVSAAERDAARTDSPHPLPCVAGVYAQPNPAVVVSDCANPLRARIGDGERLEFGGLCEVYYRLYRAAWTVRTSGVWGAQRHINVRELHALDYGLRDLLAVHGAAAVSKRPVCFVDSLVALGVAAKGRASSHELLTAYRSIAALLLGTGIAPHWRYVSSEWNPADAPSRQICPIGITVRGG